VGIGNTFELKEHGFIERAICLPLSPSSRSPIVRFLSHLLKETRLGRKKVPFCNTPIKVMSGIVKQLPCSVHGHQPPVLAFTIQEGLQGLSCGKRTWHVCLFCLTRLHIGVRHNVILPGEKKHGGRQPRWHQ